MFKRRLGPDPHGKGPLTPALNGCPDVWELESGDFAVIGMNVTSGAQRHLPQSASCGPDEAIVIVPREIFLAAKPDIPEE